MKVIITGGTGLIGRALTAKLLAKHHDVYVLSRNPEKYKSRTLNNVQLVQWDGKTANGWGKLVDGNTAIINLAGASLIGERIFPPQKWTPERKALIRDSRAEAGTAVVEAVKQADTKPKFVLQSSAIGYYGTKTGDDKLTESAPHGEDFPAMVCIPWEKSTQPVEEMGVRRAIIRTGLVLSNKGGILPQMMTPFKFFTGGPIGSGWQWMSWIHIADQISAMVYLLENENLSGTFNLTAPEPVRNEAFARAIGKAMKRPAFFQTPGTVFKVAFGELSVLLLEGQRVIPQALLDSGYQFQFTNVEAAIADLMKQE